MHNMMGGTHVECVSLDTPLQKVHTLTRTSARSIDIRRSVHVRCFAWQKKKNTRKSVRCSQPYRDPVRAMLYFARRCAGLPCKLELGQSIVHVHVSIAS